MWGALCLWIVLGFPLCVHASLHSELLALIEKDSPPNSEWSILIQPVNEPKPLFAYQPSKRLVPASNMKIPSSAAILLRLGPDFTYKTQLYISGTISGKTLQGDLIVVGSGDPSIGGRFNSGDITHLFKQWAALLKNNNIEIINGRVIGIDDIFDDKAHGLDWHPDDLLKWYAAEISGLSLNDGCLDLIIRGGNGVGNAAIVRKEPNTNYMKIINQVKTVSSHNAVRGIHYEREIDSRTLTLTGSIRARQTVRKWTTVPNPTHFFTTVLRENLQKQGIEISGQAYDADDLPSLPPEEKWTLLDEYESPPLSQLLSVCLKKSQNHYAEHFLKTLGYYEYGRGSSTWGAAAIKDIFFKYDSDLDRQYFADGSGLSRDNRLNAKSIIKVLRAMYTSPYGKTFRETLSQAGVDGTLKNRMRGTAAHGNVWAKTGTLNGVRALSGYLYAQSGKTYLVSFLANGETRGTRFSRIIDKACVLICEKG